MLCFDLLWTRCKIIFVSLCARFHKCVFLLMSWYVFRFLKISWDLFGISLDFLRCVEIVVGFILIYWYFSGFLEISWDCFVFLEISCDFLRCLGIPLEFLGYPLEFLHFTIRIVLYHHWECLGIQMEFLGFPLEFLHFMTRIVMQYQLEVLWNASGIPWISFFNSCISWCVLWCTINWNVLEFLWNSLDFQWNSCTSRWTCSETGRSSTAGERDPGRPLPL